jgi:hypothetical protein
MFFENKLAYEPQNMCKFRLVLDFGLKILSEIYLSVLRYVFLNKSAVQTAKHVQMPVFASILFWATFRHLLNGELNGLLFVQLLNMILEYQTHN